MQALALRAADWLVEFGLCALAFFLPIGIAGATIWTYFSFAAFILRMSLARDFRILASGKFWVFVILGLFLFFCGLSILNSGPLAHASLKAFFDKWLKGAFLATIAMMSLKDPHRLKRVLLFMAAGAAQVTADVLSQRFLGHEFLRGHPLSVLSAGSMAVTGPFFHYNALGAYLIVVLPVIFAFSLQPAWARKQGVGFLILGLLATAALALTLSRGAWLGFAAEIILMACLSGNPKKLFVFPLVLVLLLLFLGPLKDRFLYIFKPGGDSLRLEVWSVAWGMIKDHPFLGQGLGTFMSHFREYNQSLGVSYAHNCYLQMWAECGIFALLSFTAYIAYTLRAGLRKFCQTKSMMVLGLVAALMGFCIHAFFETHLYALQLATLFWFISGMVLSQA